MTDRGGAASPRALIVVENCSVPFDRRVWREAQTLRDAGWQVVVISPKAVSYSRGGSSIGGEDQPYELLEGIHIYRYPLSAAEGGPAGFLLEYAVALWQTARLTFRVWRRHGFDVMQVCNPPDVFFPFAWLCRLTGKGFIFDHHDLVPESISERWHGAKGAVLETIARWSEWLTMKGAHVVMATNESYKEIAETRGHVPSSRIFVVRNGPRAGSVQRGESDRSLRRGRPFLVGYLGIMGPQDGTRILLEAIRITILDAGRRDVQFLLVGDGPERPWLLAQSRQWGIEEYVTLPGLAVTMDDWQRYLSAPDICVAPEAPTAFNSNSTITKSAEYMIMGQPVVAFDLKETRRTAQDAAVYATPPGPEALSKAILDLLDDSARRVRMAAEAERRARQALSWESQEPALLAAYRTALNHS
jgi:glycosyltransferase involved in cell wall biosynthesis